MKTTFILYLCLEMGVAVTIAGSVMLSPAELRLVKDPLESSSGISKWARELTARADTDEGKARLLFDAIAQRPTLVATVRVMENATACSAFEHWNDPAVYMGCQEKACLYVAAARAVGLKAQMVHVEEMCDGQKSPHCCSALWLGERMVLVDPAYGKFGVAHKRFIVLSDTQMSGAYLSTLDDLQYARIAVKLVPELAFVHMNLCQGLLRAQRYSEVREVLPTLKRLDSNGSMWRSVEASLASQNGEYYRAARLLFEAIAINEWEPALRIDLGDALAGIGKIPEARDAYASVLQLPHTAHEAEIVVEAVKALERVDGCVRVVGFRSP